jgi:hypothetical protein
VTELIKINKEKKNREKIAVSEAEHIYIMPSLHHYECMHAIEDNG